MTTKERPRGDDNGLYKTERVHRQGDWRNIQDLEMATLGWVKWSQSLVLTRSYRKYAAIRG